MSSTVEAPYKNLGTNGDYKVEMNYGLRFYPPEDPVPEIGFLGASLKGGQKTNFIGLVPILISNKEGNGLNVVGQAEITKIVSAKPENMAIEDIKACGFETMKDAVEFVIEKHNEEYLRDGVLTVYYFRIDNLESLLV